MSPRAEFDDFVRENIHKFLSFELQLCGREDLAKDLVQNACLKVWRHWATEGPAAKRHMYPALRSVFIDEFRASKRKAEVSIDSHEDRLVLHQENFFPEGDEEVRRAVKELPPKLQMAVFLKYYVGLKPGEIDTHMCFPQGEASRCLYRAHQKLREKLQQRAPSK